MMNSFIGDSSNSSNLNLLNLELNNQKSKSKENESKINDGDTKIVISNNISELSPNDYGYFTLKGNHIKKDLNSKNTSKEKTKIKLDMSLKSVNFASSLNKFTIDRKTGKNIKLVKNDFELMMFLAREENDFSEFRLINPEKFYQTMVNLIYI